MDFEGAKVQKIEFRVDSLEFRVEGWVESFVIHSTFFLVLLHVKNKEYANNRTALQPGGGSD